MLRRYPTYTDGPGEELILTDLSIPPPPLPGDRCPQGFSPQTNWPSQCRHCFRSEDEHDLEARVVRMYDSLQRRKSYWDMMAAEEAERRRLEMATTRGQQEASRQQKDVFHFHTMGPGANATSSSRRPFAPPPSTHSPTQSSCPYSSYMSFPPPSNSVAVNSPMLSRRSTAATPTRIPVPIKRQPFQSLPTSPNSSRRGSIVSSPSPPRNGSSRKTNKHQQQQQERRPFGGSVVDVSPQQQHFANGSMPHSPYQARPRSAAGMSAAQVGNQLVLENPFRPKPRYEPRASPRHPPSYKRGVPRYRHASPSPSSSTPNTRASSPRRGLSDTARPPWRGAVKNHDFGAIKSGELEVEEEIPLRPQNELAAAENGYSCNCLDRRELKKNKKGITKGEGRLQQMGVSIESDSSSQDRSAKTVFASSMSLDPRQMDQKKKEFKKGDWKKSTTSLYESQPTPGLSSESLDQRNSFSVHSLPRNFVLPPLEEENGSYSRRSRRPPPSTTSSRDQEVESYQQRLRRYTEEHQQSDDGPTRNAAFQSEAGALPSPPSPPRGKSPVPSLTATMDSGFHVSEADEHPLEPPPVPPLVLPMGRGQQQRELRGASRDQLEGLLECVNRRSLPCRNEENPPAALERMRKQSLGADKEVILRQAVIVEGLKLETEELQDRITKLESDLDATSEQNSELSGSLEKRSSELEGKLADAKASCFKAAEENEELRKTVKEMETLIEEVQDNFRESDAKEWRKLKTDVRKLSSACRNFQSKLRRATVRSNELKVSNKEMATKLRRASIGSNSSINTVATKAKGDANNSMIFFGSALAVTGLFVWSKLLK